MQYMMLIYGTEDLKMTPEEQQQEMQEYYAYDEEVRQRGIFVAGEALHLTSTATSVRVRDGQCITTDGPFAETREQLGGFYILNCKDLDEAIEMAAKIPGARTGTVEIRPIFVFE